MYRTFPDIFPQIVNSSVKFNALFISVYKVKGARVSNIYRILKFRDFDNRDRTFQSASVEIEPLEMHFSS